ncbi:GatB/YqeY domain-containing protein [Microaerobacter geothermalis]|uniref:GatB/YqeY domain-containing protein n=1 Tax=Microaerobacter geothermalis TaxID=674972 RepID=UPI001F23BF59|nr:GatB/YqeY domain-containing protein [Microaerobacter geothermalis]MCF6092836.1 GatB/YqeY domain-containing protein [Microaerobacter geothermalis]
MSLIERLNEDMKQAMKDKDKVKLSVIRMVRSAVKNAEIEARKELSEDEVLAVLNRELKQRRDSLQEFEKAGREDLVEKVKEEIDILVKYLPEQLSEEELRRLVEQTITEIGASSKAEMGKVMGALMPKVKGRADGKLVNQIVQQLLQ